MITVDSQQKKVLIVDDENDLRLFLRAMLEDAGYEVQEAQTGESGLELAEKVSFDVVLLDVMLPFIDGHEVCRRLRYIGTSTARHHC